ncbi:MAG: sigma-54-dependent transcriptional regulator [Candidatus Electronema sp. V4]|uniref:sigma-54-dependent transcriptional regulator n=1 Tax=Candidatus Electronema sp. V4 TaxID=3454756 RepID=UPI0040557A94
MSAAVILIIDDESAIRAALSGILEDEGFQPLTAASAEEGLALLARRDIDLILLDIWLPGMDGIEALKRIRQDWSDIPVIMISGHGSIETAVQTTRIGAFDFIEKPLSYDKVVLAVNQGLRVARLERENRLLREAAPDGAAIIGESQAIRQLRRQIERVAPTDASVLILGGHGTGKELAAQAVHRQSARAASPMVAVNCAAIPEELIESELFGYEKGAFTGADKAKKGKFDQADGSTLFLDEIGDMSLKSQAKVLRVLQEKNFERVGGGRMIEVNVRILAATNKDLEQEIKAGRFRADLFYRLNVIPLRIPDLKERLEDIPLLAAEFLRQFRSRGLGEKRLDDGALALLLRHDWPGNIRELRNLTERLVIMTPGQLITAEDVTFFLQPSAARPARPVSLPDWCQFGFKEARRQFEHDYLCKKLEDCGGNISKTAEKIGMERSHLHKKLKALGIKAEEQ